MTIIGATMIVGGVALSLWMLSFYPFISLMELAGKAQWSWWPFAYPALLIAGGCLVIWRWS